jgi:hypothetical protein
VASERAEWLLRQAQRWNSGELDAFLREVGPEFTFTPDPSFPDVDTYKGEQLRRWFRDWIGTWGENELELLEFEERSDVVLAGARWHLVDSQTGSAVPNRDFTLVFWFGEGTKLSRAAAFFDRSEAVAAADARTG